MLKFFNKINICLTEPRKIVFFMPEKIWKSLLQLLIFAIIAISPVIIQSSVKDRVSDSSKTYIEEVFMAQKIDNGLKITGGVLSGDDGLAFAINEFLIFINPNQEELENNDYAYLPIMELTTDKVNVYCLDILLYSLTYEEIGVTNLSFEKICNVDYIEFEKFMTIVNESYDAGRVYLNEGYLIPYFYNFENSESMLCYVEIYDHSSGDWGLVSVDSIVCNATSVPEGSFAAINKR